MIRRRRRGEVLACLVKVGVTGLVVMPVTFVLLAGSAAEYAGPLPAGAASCLACHGSGPAPTGPDAPPNLRTLSAQDIEAALTAFRAGTRDGTVMPRIARGFTAPEAHAIAQSLGRSREAAP